MHTLYNADDFVDESDLFILFKEMYTELAEYHINVTIFCSQDNARKILSQVKLKFDLSISGWLNVELDKETLKEKTLNSTHKKCMWFIGNKLEKRYSLSKKRSKLFVRIESKRCTNVFKENVETI